MAVYKCYVAEDYDGVRFAAVFAVSRDAADAWYAGAGLFPHRVLVVDPENIAGPVGVVFRSIADHDTRTGRTKYRLN